MMRSDRPMEPKQLSCGQATTGLWICILLTATGCQTFGRQSAEDQFDGDSSEIRQAGYSDSDSTDDPEQPVAAAPTMAEKTQKNATAMLNYVTFKEQQDVTRAKELYKEGDRLFGQAKSEPKAASMKTYAEAAKSYQRAGEAAPKTALEQDALYMQGESLFFADRLPDATDTYQKLQKEYPRNRHLDRVAARLFSISRYWIDVAKTEDGKWFSLNLTDAKRPRLDIDGHAIRVLDQIRFDDPTGRLADDATMAAAAEYIRQKKFVEADEFLTDIRETFSDSEHLFLAHLLGIKCKLESYAGPSYSPVVLEEAAKLVKQTRQRFPDKLGEEKYGEMVARASAEIERHRADRIASRADYWEDRKEYRAARVRYNELLMKYPNTPHADTARTRLAQIENLPDVPEQRLSWLTNVFPDSRSKSPLETTGPIDGKPVDSKPLDGQPVETILR